jgi:OmpA-OmpF porin, OOP family
MARVLAAVLALAAGLAAFPAAAQIGQLSGFYAGGSLGASKVKTFCTDPAWFGGVGGCDNNGTALRVFGGYQMNRNIAFEIGYHHLGEASVPATDVRFSAFDAVSIFALPFGSGFSVYGKFGFMHGTAKAPRGKETNVDITYGAGLQYELWRGFAVRGEWQRYPGFGGPGPVFGADTDVDVFSLGALYRF